MNINFSGYNHLRSIQAMNRQQSLISALFDQQKAGNIGSHKTQDSISISNRARTFSKERIAALIDSSANVSKSELSYYFNNYHNNSAVLDAINFGENVSCGYDALDIEEIESIRYKANHTIIHTSSWFSDEAGEELQKVKEEKGTYNGSDILNAYGFTYARLYAEIEQRYENGNGQWFGLGGEPLTKEKEIEELNKAYESAVDWVTKCAEVMAGIQNIDWTTLHKPTQNSDRPTPEAPKPEQKDLEEMKRAFYEIRDKYMELYRRFGQGATMSQQ